MATPIIGKELKIYLDSSIVGYAESFDYQIDRNVIPIETLDGGEWETGIQYGKTFSGNVNGLFCRTVGDSSRGITYLMNHFITSNASLAVEFKPDGITSNQYTKVNVFLTSLKVNNPGNKSFVTYSATMQGCGPVTTGTTS